MFYSYPDLKSKGPLCTCPSWPIRPAVPLHLSLPFPMFASLRTCTTVQPQPFLKWPFRLMSPLLAAHCCSPNFFKSQTKQNEGAEAFRLNGTFGHYFYGAGLPTCGIHCMRLRTASGESLPRRSMWSAAWGPPGQTLLILPHGPLCPFMSPLRADTAPLRRHSVTKVSIKYRSYNRS